MLQQWQTRSTLDLPFTRDEDCSAALPVEVQSPAHLKTIFLGAGQPLNYAIDSAFQFLELEPEFSRAYQPRTSMLARAARDVVASTLGRALKDVDLKPVLWLDKASHRASPMWCIRFRSTGLAANAMQDIEGNLRALVGLIASDGRTLWATPIADLLPDIEAAEAVVKAAKEVRSTAGGKPAAPDCRVTSPDFSTEIELPTKIGSGPDSEQEAVVKVGVGEVMGYNRQARQMDFLIDGHSTTTDISMDMAVFRELVQSLAGSDGNECRIWYRIDREDGKAVRTTLCKLQHIQSDLFNQLPDFKEAEVTADPVTA
ncbi:MAG: hypothetical protein HZC37_14225 [Burkholderiales bacterium]|nr:hypothetical protein [Burkholderiales bacterium]